MRGHSSEGRRSCERFLEAATNDPRDEQRVRWAGWVCAFNLGDYAAARRFCTPTVERAPPDDASPEVLMARIQLAALGINEGRDRSETFDAIGALRPLTERVDEPFLLAFIDHFLAIGERLAGRHDAAMRLHEMALNRNREAGDLRNATHSLSGLGLTHMARGDFGAARACFEEALAIRRELGDQSTIPWSLTNLGDVAIAVGDLDGAVGYFSESLTALRRLGDRLGQADALASLGRVHRRRGDLAAAHATLREALALRHEAGQLLAVPELLVQIGGVALAGANAEQALRLFGAAEALATSLGATFGASDREQLTQWSTDATDLAGATAADAYAAGHELSHAAAVALGLD
jgi:tetratricopeptide (TPR) repeat protein